MLMFCSSGGVVAQAFKSLPSRKYYAEYFQVISRPISLSQIRSKVSQSKYDGWPGFEDDVLLIRKNAEEYNAEGSDIVKDARTLEVSVLSSLSFPHFRISSLSPLLFPPPLPLPSIPIPSSFLPCFALKGVWGMFDGLMVQTYFLRRLHDEKVKLGDPASSGIKLRLNLGPEQDRKSVV